MNGIDPAVIEQILSLQNDEENPEAIALARKQKMVDALRGQVMHPAEGQMIGKHYVAPGWGQHVATLANGLSARKMQGDADTGMQRLNTTRLAGRRGYFEALQKALRQQPQAPAMGEDIGTGY